MKTNTIKELLESIENLKRSEVAGLVDARIKEFWEAGKKPSSEIFKELCFCILCANFNAERSIEIQRKIGDGFLTLSEFELAVALRHLGHRFPNTRAKYVVQARRFKDSLRDFVGSFDDRNRLRDWLVQRVKGIGPKEASHFLRNIGYADFAILDFHIINILARHNLIEKPKTLTMGKYLGIENMLRKIAVKTRLNLAELDLYLWYMETGKVLK